MKKKPIKRNPYIVTLSKDHHFSLLFCWKIRKGLNAGIELKRILDYVAYFWNHHMKDHFKEEEEILFVSARKDDMVIKAIDDHEKIKMIIDELQNNSSTGFNDKLLTELADLVDDHVRYEERILFPHLEQLLSEDELKSIGEKLDQHVQTDDYKDEFWKNIPAR